MKIPIKIKSYFKRPTRKSVKRFLKNCLLGVLVLIFAMLLGISVRVFLLASFVIPTWSMSPTIMPGDFVMINKQIPGPRIFKSWDFLNGDFTMKRLGGYRKIRRNEVIVFNFPYSNHYKLDLDFNVFYAKRCVAVAGDTFYIDNGIYRVKNCCDTLGYYENQLKVSQMESEQDAKSGTWNCFPYDTVYYKWNIKNFGPLYVPAANDTLSIDSLNIKLYKNLIEYETSQEISVVNGTVLLGGDTLNRYIFLKNYYFVTGDYAPDSHDSRYWGLLPEDHIAGKAFIIWKSQDRNTGKYNWKRFFKSL